MNDPIADAMTRIRNAQTAYKKQVILPLSKFIEHFVNLLLEEGYISGVRRIEAGDANYKHGALEVTLKYHSGRPAIMELKKISTPGRRVYVRDGQVPKVYNGLGIAILSTSKGLMTDIAAHRERIGGELICKIF